MFLDLRLRKAITFLVVDINGRRTEVGTTFFIAKSLDVEDETGIFNTSTPALFTMYAVTTRHTVVDYVNEVIFIRVNTSDGGFVDLPTLSSEWIVHPETDVAVYDILSQISALNRSPIKGAQTSVADIRVLNFSMLATSEYLNETQVSEGHEVFILGLFREHAGKRQALPIVRFGHIALMPWEPVEVYLSRSDLERGKPSDIAAHLVECNSIQGVSGSPVLFYDPPLGSNVVAGSRAIDQSFMTQFQLPVILGLVHGHYGEEESRFVREVNAGVSIVIPSQKIRETIMQEKLVDQRKRTLRDKT